MLAAYPKIAGDCPSFAQSSEPGTDRRLVADCPLLRVGFRIGFYAV
jgi:hypothetical protein